MQHAEIAVEIISLLFFFGGGSVGGAETFLG